MMDGDHIHPPVDAPRVIERSPGVQPVYRVANVDGSATFAAKWKLDDAQIASGNLAHGILACRTAGTATVMRRSKGTCVRRRPTIGAVTYVAPDSPALWSGDGSCEVCHVYLSQDAIGRFTETDMTGGRVPRINDLFAIEEPWLKGYFQMLISEFELFAEGKQRADELFVTQAEHLLIHHLLRWHSDAGSEALSTLQHPYGVNPLRSITLKRIQEYIAANLGGEIALPDLATIACMSIGHFLRAFRAALGTTPYHYVLEQRLSRACSLLRTTSLPISRIARECGFRTPSHLSSKFRARVGASPSRYRARTQGETVPGSVPPAALIGASSAPREFPYQND